jgi:predicted RecB family nuclease
LYRIDLDRAEEPDVYYCSASSRAIFCGMLRIGETIHLSASDLVGHLNCRHLTNLDLAVANGTLAKPFVRDPLLEILAERGTAHEEAYIEYLRAKGLSIVALGGIGVDAISAGQTIDAMKAGAEVITQGALQLGHWSGRADILRRVETPSHLGAWSYEAIDTKLARETKAGTVLQICLYSELVGAVQKRVPEFAYVVAPGTGFEGQPFRVTDYAAYFRRVKRSLERAVTTDASLDSYPDPIAHCEVCRWRFECQEKRRIDDHLCLTAGISKSQIAELKRHDVSTLAKLASVPLPLPWKPDRGAVESYVKIREQARIQVEGRTKRQTLYEALPVLPGFGLSSLPQPSPGDVFLDLEGDPFVGDSGLEFLFGYAFEDTDGSTKYTGDWAISRIHERTAFEGFVDFLIARLEKHPDLHIYHFAPYEPAALKRLMGRYATREDELDRMLRAGLFVDLYAVVRKSIRASVESYSIKKLEPLYKFERSVSLTDANKALVKVQACLELGDVENIKDEDRAIVQGYNRDDCISTWHLRDWLENLREELIKKGTAVDRPAPKLGDPSPDVSDWQQKIAGLIRRLTEDVPMDVERRSPEQHARWLLAYILDWHRREEKAAWWEYFRLCDLSVEDLLEERAALSGLTFVEEVSGTATFPVHRYSFPPQETDLRGDEEVRCVGGGKFGKIDEISLEARTVDIKKRRDTADLHPAAVFSHQIVSSEVLADALVRIGEHVADNGMLGRAEYEAARDLLMRVAPRLGEEKLREPNEAALHAGIRIAPLLEGGVLPIQGPPGTGKTHIGARMICTLAQAGKRIGITANSHSVIRNILDEVIEAANELGTSIQCFQKVSEAKSNLPGLQFTTDNAALLAAIATNCQVAGGTAWLWARPDACQSVDALFIDEAAQMSLANVLAVSQAAKTIVLLGDPRQLEQPTQGTHPEGTEVSALDHVLGDHPTIPADRGLFLEETWRLHPQICTFTSEVFYEGRLHSRPELALQTVKSNSRINGSGLRFRPVVHEGNQSSSREEADEIRTLVTQILDSNATWINRDGKETPISLDDILIIAPYNAQVFELQDRIPGGRIGTVDKFQGQEAPIVIYSITTSSHADAPRGMEFLYSANRLNVATSRAKCICVLVGSPLIFEAECRTPRQIQLANAFCRYLEMATII